MITNMIQALLCAWLIALTFVVWNVRAHYHRLITRTRRKSIDDILDQLMQNNELIRHDQQKIQKELVSVQNGIQKSFQKLGVVRFNAFGKTEGEQSFVIALLNEKNDGIVLNFIYIHEGIRVYMKSIKAGKGEKLELSEEEKQAISKAS